MQRRAAFSLVNLAVAAGALIVFFGFPRYADYAVYVFLGWLVVGFTAVWLARPTGMPAQPSTASPGAPAAAGTPLPRAPASAPWRAGVVASPEIGFCIFCASDLPAGVPRCPACGHAVVRLR